MLNLKEVISYQKWGGCVAVVVENCIVVTGGVGQRGNELRSVEMFNFNNNSWDDLPIMNQARWCATAVAV